MNVFMQSPQTQQILSRITWVSPRGTIPIPRFYCLWSQQGSVWRGDEIVARTLPWLEWNRLSLPGRYAACGRRHGQCEYRLIWRRVWRRRIISWNRGCPTTGCSGGEVETLFHRVDVTNLADLGGSNGWMESSILDSIGGPNHCRKRANRPSSPVPPVPGCGTTERA
jgi:hypothetical protein